jgi:hypothetical protein
MGTRNHKYLPITGKEWIETTACLSQEALRTDNRAELLRAVVPHDLHGQIPQPNPIAARQQHGPQMLRRRRGW